MLNKPQPENMINEYKKALEKEGWAAEREYGINMRKGEFILSVSARENRDSINIHLIKRDWIYHMGL